MKFILHTSFCLMLMHALTGHAQQRMQFTQYMVNQYVLNPAAGGIDTDLELTVGYRKQWVNFEGGPVTFYFSGHMPIRERRKPGKRSLQKPFHSAGTLLYKDRTGPVSKTSFLASYSYNLPLFRNYRLALGLFAGMVNVNLDHSQLKFDQPGETVNFDKKTLPDGSAGLWFYNDRFFLGTSVNQLFFNSVKLMNTDNYLIYHYYATAGYKIPLGYPTGKRGEYDFYLVPSTMFKYGGRRTPVSVDLNVKLNYKKFLWAGASYRHLDAFAFLGGVRFGTKHVGMFELGYSYDYTVSGIHDYTSGSHEIILRYTHKQKSTVICPDKFW